MYHAELNKSLFTESHGATSYHIFQKENTPIEGCIVMVNRVENTDYPPFGVHDDNEGFYVIEGTGMMVVGGQEFELRPGVAMYAPVGVPHAIKKTGDAALVIFIHHFPVTDAQKAGM